MDVLYSKKFLKEYKKAPVDIKESFKKRLKLFLANQYHPQLHNHALKGEYRGMGSINVSGDWRALYIERFIRHGHSSQKAIEFKFLGTHSQLYKT